MAGSKIQKGEAGQGGNSTPYFRTLKSRLGGNLVSLMG